MERVAEEGDIRVAKHTDMGPAKDEAARQIITGYSLRVSTF